MKTLLAVMLVLMAGCSTMEKLGVYVQENPVLAHITSTQLVLRYIEKAPEALRDIRADRVVKTLKSIKSGFQADTGATVGTLLEIVDSKIDWGGMSRADKALVKNLITIVQGSLLKDKVDIDPDAAFSLVELIDSMILQAETF